MSDSHDKAALTVIPEHSERAMSPLVAMGLRVLERSPDPATLRELLAVQREWEAGEARKAYAMALVGLKRDLPTVMRRDAKVDFTGNSGKRTTYTHASLAGVMDAITGPLTQHGFSLAWTPTTDKDGVSVTCRLTHSAGHFEEATISAPPDTSGSKSPAQAIASTITLLSRYSALALLGIATADMPEPEGEAPPPSTDKVDSARNLRAVASLKKHGKSAADAEEYLGREVADWTDADIERLKAWVTTSGGAA
jgi:hypothetical protein